MIKTVNVRTGKRSEREWTAEERARHDAAIAADKEKITYAARRREEYPPIGDQLDAIMKWLSTETELPDELKSVAMKCMAVKAKYPK